MGLGNLALCRTFCEGSHSKYRRMLPVKRDHFDFPPVQHTSTFIHSCLALPVWWFVEVAVRVLLHCQDRLVVLLQSQEVNPEAVWHRLLLGVVLELSSSVKEHLTQRLSFRFTFSDAIACLILRVQFKPCQQ